MENEIPICGDGWLAVFNLVAPRQLGLEIALLSHRFDFYIDEHFKTRKLTLGLIRICHKELQNDDGGTTTEMQIFNSEKKLLPTPKKQLPNKVVGFGGVHIFYNDEKVADFLLHFRRLFATCATSLIVDVKSYNTRTLNFVVHKIWPFVKDNNACDNLQIGDCFHNLRQLAPSFLSDWPSLRIFQAYHQLTFPAFPADDSANATDGQVLAKWLFTPHPNNVPKVLLCETMDWKTKIEGFKTAFVNASTPSKFIFVFWDEDPSAGEPFELTNELTGERLVLKLKDRMYDMESHTYYLCRCPILRDEKQWIKWEKEATEIDELEDFDKDYWNKIAICDYEFFPIVEQQQK